MKKIILFWLLIFSAVRIEAGEVANVQAGPLTAMCTLSPASDSQVKGWVKFTEKGSYVEVEGDITGLTPGKHGFHVHEKGDCSAPDAASAGGHFNPEHQDHGSPKNVIRHVGDLGNIKADKDGKASFRFKDKVIRLSGKDSIIDKALILHADLDDMKTQPTGNAGKRVACGVIERMK